MVDSSNTMNGTVHGDAVQAGYIGNVYLDGRRPPAVADGDDPWVHTAADSRAWHHVRADRDAEPYRRAALAAVRRLARLRDEAHLTDDPWQEPGIALRFAARVGWLLGDEPLDLYPAEAALLAVLPFLYRVRSLRLAAARATVRPTDLQASGGPDGDRAAYEQFIESHDLLTHRARTRPDSAAPLGWWLYHRWLDQHEDLADPDGVRELLDALPELAELGETFSPKRVCALLHGLRRGPDVTNRDYLAGLSADDHLRAPGEQHVREPRLALLLALAYGTAIETTALPDIVAEHLGIPHEVDLPALRRTLDEAVWGGSYDLPVLRAACHHEAVVEGLREYTARADELLHAVRRVLVDHPLPTRLTSDEAAPAGGAFTGWARFRLDERRVRSLLMGVELYRDRDLAVRELYQNALDACRYRRARTEYLDRTNTLGASFSYDGRIEFRQGVDEEGRAYLECQDNGVGMGEAELRGVFSNAGARFAEQLDFTLERAEWRKADPPVELYPNSRFGIGVLSYFMLADEIRVTTCRMDATGRRGPLLEVSIHGPGHLFRIVEREDTCRKPGTTVRLFLRDDIDLAASWSALEALERLLGIAEFTTTAVHEERRVEWEPGTFRSRSSPTAEEFGIGAWGALVPWTEAPSGVHVTWCEYGGALLVDGLFVQPSASRRLMAPGRGPVGVVVNLSGPWAPSRLSVDRRQVIDDVSDRIGGLLKQAVVELVGTGAPLLSMEWLTDVMDGDAELADVVAAECVRQGRVFDYCGIEFETRRTGCFPVDIDVLDVVGIAAPGASGRKPQVAGRPGDSVVLWRLLAHRRQQQLEALADVCPELLAVGDVRVAMPSDQVSMTTRHGVRFTGTRYWRSPGREVIAMIAARLGADLDSAEEWAISVGMVPGGAPGGGRRVTVTGLVVEAGYRDVSVTEVAEEWLRDGADVSRAVRDLALAVESDPVFLRAREEHGRFRDWPEPGDVVAPGHLVKASVTLGVPVPEVARAMAGYGLKADPTGLPAHPSDDLLVPLSSCLDGSWPWLLRAEVVPAAHVLRVAEAREVGIGQVLDFFTDLGFRTPTMPQDASVEDLDLFERRGARWGDPAEVPFRHAFGFLDLGDTTLEEVVDWYRAYGSPMCLPGPATRLDRELFQVDGAVDWEDLAIGDTVPFARLITAAHQLHRRPEELAGHLRSRGIDVSCDGLPSGLTHREALQILGDIGREPIYVGRGLSLATLLEVSQRTGRSIAQIAVWLREWGVPVPDVAETIRAALARVPMADPS
ncbi:ATP-binding protein [Kitasatospora sp. NPDC101447]|uniref:HD domain-containing protein n=1 Tax=Kitasatospora sp. NPDC101447 TaxID=3364102 RepID=UPI0037F33C9A